MKRALLIFVPTAVALVVAGCGGGGSSSKSANNSGPYGGSGSSAKSTPASTGSKVVDVRKTGLGRILVNSQGQTLYLFEKDKGTRSTCSAACAAAWPPLTASGTATGGAGLSAAKLATSSRGGGMMQVTYAGHPLYTYAGDSSPGQTNGEGLNQFGAEWYVLSPSGKKVEKEGS
jgi:predicted lipoprotein with Yx(FWY)xxD motif